MGKERERSEHRIGKERRKLIVEVVERMEGKTS